MIKELILDSKSNNLDYNIFHNFIKDNEPLNKFFKYCDGRSRREIPEEDLNLFNGLSELKREVSSAYADTDVYCYSLFTGPEQGTSIHYDLADVIHWNCQGQVEWEITDSSGVIHKETLFPGDVLYLKEGTYHSTQPLSARGGIVLTLLPDSNNYS